MDEKEMKVKEIELLEKLAGWERHLVEMHSNSYYLQKSTIWPGTGRMDDWQSLHEGDAQRHWLEFCAEIRSLIRNFADWQARIRDCYKPASEVGKMEEAIEVMREVRDFDFSMEKK